MSIQLRMNEIRNRLNELDSQEAKELRKELSILQDEVIDDDPIDYESYLSQRQIENREQSERYDDMLDMYSLAGING